jgi:hypothetical protein
VEFNSLLSRIISGIVTFTFPNKYSEYMKHFKYQEISFTDFLLVRPSSHITRCEPFKNLKLHITSSCKGFCCPHLCERGHYHGLLLSRSPYLMFQPYIYFKTCPHICLQHLSGKMALYSHNSPSWISHGSQASKLSNKTYHTFRFCIAVCMDFMDFFLHISVIVWIVSWLS